MNIAGPTEAIQFESRMRSIRHSAHGLEQAQPFVLIPYALSSQSTLASVGTWSHHGKLGTYRQLSETGHVGKRWADANSRRETPNDI